MYGPPTLTVHEQATVRSQPSELMMVAEVTAAGQTLQLALELLQRKRKAVADWMARLGAREVRFGTPRFPDQVVPAATQMAERIQRRVRQQLSPHRSAEPPQESGRNVVVCFAATWSIAGMSADEVLILADRVRLEASEAENRQDAKSSAAEGRWSEQSIPDFGAMMAAMSRPSEGNEPHFLFLSQISEDCYRSTLSEAFRRAEREAQLLARAAGKELGEVTSIHSVRRDDTSVDQMNQMHRLQHAPALFEFPLHTARLQQVSESPKAADFTFTVGVTYALAERGDDLSLADPTTT